MSKMLYTGAVCVIADWLGHKLWQFNVEGIVSSTHLPPVLAAIQFTVLYFAINIALCALARYFIGLTHIPYHTNPLRLVMSLAILAHIAGAIAYWMGLGYERPYEAGIAVLTVAQVLCFVWPLSRRRIGHLFRSWRPYGEQRYGPEKTPRMAHRQVDITLGDPISHGHGIRRLRRVRRLPN